MDLLLWEASVNSSYALLGPLSVAAVSTGEGVQRSVLARGTHGGGGGYAERKHTTSTLASHFLFDSVHTSAEYFPVWILFVVV